MKANLELRSIIFAQIEELKKQGVKKNAIQVDGFQKMSKSFGVMLSSSEVIELIDESYGDEFHNAREEVIYHGPVGDIVEKIAPETEADKIAIYLQLLVALGNLFGRNSYFVVNASKHYQNLFLLIVGKSSKARKGTSWDFILHILNEVDPDWVNGNIKSGLSSGEGLINALKDSNSENEGVNDKRLLAIESEFANTLKVLKREGNTLSPIVRDAWDGKNLNCLTKNSPLSATEPYISLIGHITNYELLKTLSKTEAANGFMNRFIIVSVSRSKILPDGGSIDDIDLSSEIEKIKNTYSIFKAPVKLIRDTEAKEYWHKIYAELSADHEGLIGSILSRGEAQVLRISCLFAILDGLTTIKKEHIQAAESIWRYAEKSGQQIFSELDTQKTPVEKIKAYLKKVRKPVSKTEISTNVFSKNKSSEKINHYRDLLLNQKEITVNSEGRTEYWSIYE